MPASGSFHHGITQPVHSSYPLFFLSYSPFSPHFSFTFLPSAFLSLYFPSLSLFFLSFHLFFCILSSFFSLTVIINNKHLIIGLWKSCMCFLCTYGIYWGLWPTVFAWVRKTFVWGCKHLVMMLVYMRIRTFTDALTAICEENYLNPFSFLPKWLWGFLLWFLM